MLVICAIWLWLWLWQLPLDCRGRKSSSRRSRSGAYQTAQDLPLWVCLAEPYELDLTHQEAHLVQPPLPEQGGHDLPAIQVTGPAFVPGSQQNIIS